MVTRTTVIFIIFVLVIAGASVWLYYKYEKPKQNEQIELMNLSIFAKDTHGRLIKTGYRIEYDGGVFVEKETDRDSPVRAYAPMNKTILVYNYNLADQEYYRDFKELKTPVHDDVLRISLELLKRGDIEIIHEGEFGIQQEILVIADSKGRFKEPVMCLDWSDRVLYVDVPGEIQIDSIDSKIKCFDLNVDLMEGESTNFTLKYQYFGSISESEFINVSFYDSDFDSSNQLIKEYAQSYEIRNY